VAYFRNPIQFEVQLYGRLEDGENRMDSKNESHSVSLAKEHKQSLCVVESEMKLIKLVFTLIRISGTIGKHNTKITKCKLKS